MMQFAHRSLVAMALALTVPLAHAGNDAASAATAATTDLFVRMSARDLPGVLRYVPAEGFTEIMPDAPGVLRLGPAAFEKLFGSTHRIALRAEDLRTQVFGDTAIVTGVRVGAVAPKDQATTAAAEARVPFSSVWIQGSDGWRLRHLHLSSEAVAPTP